MVERRVVPQLQRIVPFDPIGLADRRKHLRLLDRVDPQISLEIQVHIEQIRRIPRLLSDDLQHAGLHPIT